MFINLACGEFYYEGEEWVNIDVDPQVRADVYGDVRTLPFDDETADLIYCGHLLEHFFPHEAPALIAEWLRVLKPGGELVVVVPDMKAIARDYLEGKISCKELSLDRLYSPERPMQLHKACYDEQFLREVLEGAGLTSLKPIDIDGYVYLVSHAPWQIGFSYVKPWVADKQA